MLGQEPRKIQHSKSMHGRHNCKFFCQEREPGCCCLPPRKSLASEPRYDTGGKTTLGGTMATYHEVRRRSLRVLPTCCLPCPSLPTGTGTGVPESQSRHQLCLLKSKEHTPKGQVFTFTLSPPSNPKSLVLDFNTSTEGDVPSSHHHGENDLAVRQGKKASLRQGHGRKIELAPTVLFLMHII